MDICVSNEASKQCSAMKLTRNGIVYRESLRLCFGHFSHLHICSCGTYSSGHAFPIGVYRILI